MRLIESVKGLCTLAILAGWGPLFAQPPEMRFETKWGGNRLTNGSFEEEFEGWTPRRGAEQPGDEIRSLFSIDDTVAFDGGRSLHLVGDSNTTWWYAVESWPILVEGGRSYKVDGWIRTQEVRQQDEQYLNCNLYVQFGDADGKVVEVLGSPVRTTDKVTGTKDWTYVEQSVRAPEGAVQARIGCALTCSGWAWFDDLGFFEGTGTTYTQKVTRRFVYRFEDELPSDDVIKSNAIALGKIEKLLDLPDPSPILFYKYPTRARKAEMTGLDSETHVKGRRIHTVSWKPRRELAQLVIGRLGVSIPLLANGLAGYSVAVVDDTDAHREARKYAKDGRLQKIEHMITPQLYKALPPEMAEAHAVSFTGFLIERYGPEKFRRLYPYHNPREARAEFLERFKTVYGMDIELAEKAWRSFLAAPKVKP